MENGEKQHGAGFVRMECRDGHCSITVHVTGMHVTDNYSRQVFLVGKKEAVLCDLRFFRGEGIAQKRGMWCENMDGTGISYEELRAIRIPIASGREIMCHLQDKEAAYTSPMQQKEFAPEPTGTFATVAKAVEPEPTGTFATDAKALTPEPEDNLPVEAEADDPKPMGIPPVAAEADDPKPMVIPSMAAEATDPEPMVIPPSSGRADDGAQNSSKKSYPLRDNKWNQLSELYPHITPFGDSREYLSIGPSDFVVLSEKYYSLVNNSFLLHGFYNYRHLILTREKRKDEAFYYIGVPGNYFEREKQVAVMFGFESFECLEEPARSGDFGYYMMRISL